ncbi:MAG: chemotaxis protein CheA [Gallionellales bacterium 35-53-114]|jgi:two-component system chemotaxis sensor kinase CheA|nr:MAG: chemotaxis protein CheA [Gallionellales bacterium 35-53-114]OYZ64253.1 MAG: chemotaxis protein CheA [Gallionellales bacterium 24-53-125]HQS57053.1 chemotaxis protein CheA [Gallionellaceae bacterium]HQS74759.1 chemotaxis protein CheA [Gallionellaceae bacterium]
MGDFTGMEDLLQDFLMEASDLLSDVDSKLMDLEKSPQNKDLLNVIFRGFHTIKGGAGFLNAHELVTLCHLTENLFDKLRNSELQLDPALLDVILAATGEVRLMFNDLGKSVQPQAAPADMLSSLEAALQGKKIRPRASADAKAKPAAPAETSPRQTGGQGGPDWDVLYNSLLGKTSLAVSEPPVDELNPLEDKVDIDEHQLKVSAFGRRAEDIPGGSPAPAAARRETDPPAKDNTIRVDTDRLDQVLNLSGEIGLTKNRLTHLRSDILHGNTSAATLKSLDESVNQLDMLVVNLQNAVMNTRMQPIGRLFKKYPRLARDLARQLGKDVELELSGETTEIDKTMIEDLNDPLVHLVRNAVDHGVESAEQRAAAGKPSKSIVQLSARQEGDHILITITDDGRGMNPEVLRNKAVQKGLITSEEANALSEDQSLNLVFMPGFSTKDEISSVSGRGVGMDVVNTNIQKLNGTIEIKSLPGKGSMFVIVLPLTLAILPVLLVRLSDQPFAVPLSMVREIMSVEAEGQQLISGKPTMVVRGEVLPVLSLARLIGWEESGKSEVGVLMQMGSYSFILTADGFDGHDDVVIKSLDTFRPKGVAGVTMSSEGKIVMILDVKELLM